MSENTIITTSVKQKRCAVYLRCSTDEQKKFGFGIRVQKDNILRFIRENAENGWVFDESKHLYIDEGKSGSLEHREAFDAMKRAMKKGEIDIVIVDRFDRLFRNVKYSLMFIDDYCIDDIEFKSVLESYIDPKTDEGRMFLSFSQTMSENERTKITKVMMSGKRLKAGLGHSVCGTVKFGYLRIKGNIPEINEAEAPTIRRMFDLLVNKGKTQSEIAKIFTAEKVPTRSDLDYKSSKKKVNSYGTWTQEKVSEYLKSETYIGRGYFGRTLQKKLPGGKTQTIIRPKEEWILQKCPAIIDEETFNKAQAILNNRANLPRKKHCRKYLLAGIFKCSKCGRSYQGYASGKNTIHYRCNGGKSRMRNEFPCDNKQISGSVMDKFVWKLVTSLLSNPKKFSAEFERLSSLDNKLSKYTDELEVVNKKLEQEGRKIKEAYIMILSAESDIAKSAFDDIIKTINGQISYLSEQQRELTQLIKAEQEKLEVSKNINTLSLLYKKNLENIENHFETKEKLIKTLIKRIEVGEKILKVFFQFNNQVSYNENDESHLICMEYKKDSIK